MFRVIGFKGISELKLTLRVFRAFWSFTVSGFWQVRCVQLIARDFASSQPFLCIPKAMNRGRLLHV